MKLSPRLSAAALALLVLPLHADSLDDRLDALRQSFGRAADLIAAAPPGDAARGQRLVVSAEMLRRYADGLRAESGENLAAALRQISAMEGLPAETAAEIRGLLGDLPKLTADRDESAVAAADALVKKVAAACLAAKSEAELDPILREVSRPLRAQYASSEDPRMARSYRKLQAAQRTASQWQDYLAHRAAGNAKAADSILQSLGNQGDYPVIPQDEIKRRLSAAEPVQGDAELVAVIRGIKTLDALPAALSGLRAQATGRDTEYSARFANLGQIANAHAAFRAGFFGVAFQTASENGQSLSVSSTLNDWTPELLRLKGLLLLEVLPRYLELPAAPQPAPGENGATYLLRLGKESAGAGRWAECARIIDTYRIVAFRNQAEAPGWIAEDVAGLKAFAAGEQLAEARAFAEAINSFRAAAAAGGKYTPAARAAARIGEITAAHPEEAKVAAAAGQTEQQIKQMQQKITSEVSRAFESRLPPDMRSRMMPLRPNP